MFLISEFRCWTGTYLLNFYKMFFFQTLSFKVTSNQSFQRFFYLQNICVTVNNNQFFTKYESV